MPGPRGMFEVRKSDLLDLIRRNPEGRDLEFAKQLGVSGRYVKMMVKALKSGGVISVERRRHRLPVGWANTRKINVLKEK